MLEIKKANIDDVIVIIEIRKKSILSLAKNYYSNTERIKWANLKITKANIIESIKNNEYWLLEVDHIKIGWGKIAYNRRNLLSIRGFYILSEYSCKGYGTKLLQFLENILKENKIKEISFGASFSAVQFYLKNGYTIIESKEDCKLMNKEF